MKEEFTTKMHEELIGKEICHADLKIMGVFGAIKRGISIKDACDKYGMTVKFYNDNYKSVIFKI